jgi:hypothetical protein
MVYFCVLWQLSLVGDPYFFLVLSELLELCIFIKQNFRNIHGKRICPWKSLNKKLELWNKNIICAEIKRVSYLFSAKTKRVLLQLQSFKNFRQDFLVLCCDVTSTILSEQWRRSQVLIAINDNVLNNLRFYSKNLFIYIYY